MGERVRLSEARRNVLRVFAEGGGPGESWSQYFDGMSSSALAWANHELAIVVKPMIDMLRAKGLNDEQIAAALNEAARRAGVKLSVRVVDKEPD